MEFGGDPAIAYAISRGVRSHPPGPRNPALDVSINCGMDGVFGVAYALTEDHSFYRAITDPGIARAISSGVLVAGTAYPGGVTGWANSLGVLLVEDVRQNWVKWSDIGNLDFTIGITNIAGERPMEWSGLVYEIKKLGNTLVIYGANGISIMTPHETSFGLNELSPIGIKGRYAIAGTELSHFFIDTLGYLYRFDSKLENLGYQEYLKDLNDPILTLDQSTGFLYICDNTLGFVYSTITNSFGSGPVSITGMGYQNSINYISAPEDITIPAFEVWTDIIDMGTRDAKTLHSIGFGTDLSEDLEASIEFRVNKRASFIRLPWVPVNPQGVAYLFCHGIEFRIGVKTNTYTYLELDSISIEGRIT